MAKRKVKKKAAKKKPVRKKHNGLVPKRARFVEEYLKDLCATKASIRAGYSPKTAASQGERLLRNVEVKTAIKKALDERSKRTRVTVDDIVREYARIAFSDIREHATYGQDGVVLKDSSKLTDDAARCVSEVSETLSESSHTLRYKLHSKIAALDSLAKHLGMFIDKVEHSGPDGEPLKQVIIIGGQRIEF